MLAMWRGIDVVFVENELQKKKITFKKDFIVVQIKKKSLDDFSKSK